MTKETTNAELIILDNLDASKLPELKGLEEKQIKLVEENPFVEITDNKSYELACKHRTALLKGRTSLESQEKLIVSKLTSFRKDVGAITKKLIDITLPNEEKQQAEVKRYENIKEAEKAEKERLERERVENIKNKISELETKSYELINSWDVSVLQNADSSIFAGMDTDFDFEEYYLLFDQAKARVQEHCEMKIKSLREKEDQRLENERLAREKAESDAKLKAIEEQQEKEAAERAERERIEKEKVFEVRKKRLIEIGFITCDFVDKLSSLESVFQHELLFSGISAQSIYECDVLEFEDILSDAKKAIQEAKQRKEQEDAEKKAREKAEIEAKKKADKENKERQKRLAKDKRTLACYIEGLMFEDLVPRLENKESEEIFEILKTKLENFRDELLTELQNL